MAIARENWLLKLPWARRGRCARCKEKLRLFSRTVLCKKKEYHLECANRRGLLSRKFKVAWNLNDYNQ